MGKLYNAYITSYALTNERNKAFFDCVGDLYFTPEVQSLSRFEQHLDIDRLSHITSVSYISFLVSRRLKLDYRTAARGAVLHDLYYYDWRLAESWHRPHGYLHPRFSLENARALCGEPDKKTCDIIRKHMWPLTPALPRFAESYIVSLADKYCAAQELMISLLPYYKRKFEMKKK